MTLFLLPFCAGGPPLSAVTLYRPSVVTPVLGKLQYRLACRNCAGYKGRISAQSYRPSQRRQRGNRSRIFYNQYIFARPVVRYRDGKSAALTGASRNARGIVAVMAGHRIRSLAFPYNVDTWSKVTVTQRPVFLIVCHRTGNFTSMTAYTSAVSSDKLIHLHPFHLMSYVFSNFAMQ